MRKNYLTLILPNYQFDNSNLNKLLARASMKEENYSTLEELLFTLFGLPIKTEMPIAAIAGLGEGLNTKQNYWLRADPVKLTSDLAAVYCQGNEHLHIELAELANVLNKMKTLLAQDDMILHTPHPKRWYLESKQPILIQTQLLAKMMGRNIITGLPTGEQQAYWLKLQTELQMLFNAEQANNSFNSIWFWGAGKLPTLKAPIQWQHVWTDEPLSKGLALLHNVLVSQPNSLAIVLRAIQVPGHYLMLVEYVDQYGLSTLSDALRSDKIDKLILKINNRYSFELTKKNLYYFWRRLNKVELK